MQCTFDMNEDFVHQVLSRIPPSMYLVFFLWLLIKIPVWTHPPLFSVLELLFEHHVMWSRSEGNPQHMFNEKSTVSNVDSFLFALCFVFFFLLFFWNINVLIINLSTTHPLRHTNTKKNQSPMLSKVNDSGWLDLWKSSFQVKLNYSWPSPVFGRVIGSTSKIKKFSYCGIFWASKYQK